MPNTLSTPVSPSHLLCTCKPATDVLWGESFDLLGWALESSASETLITGDQLAWEMELGLILMQIIPKPISFKHLRLIILGRCASRVSPGNLQ